MDQASIIQYIAEPFAGVDVVSPTDGVGAGDTFFSYDPERNLDPKHRFPFATIVTKDYGEFDCASNLNRPGVFRLNIGLGKDTYRSLFGPQPAAPGEAGAVDTGHDFAALDQAMPRSPHCIRCLPRRTSWPSAGRLDARPADECWPAVRSGERAGRAPPARSAQPFTGPVASRESNWLPAPGPRHE